MNGITKLTAPLYSTFCFKSVDEDAQKFTVRFYDKNGYVDPVQYLVRRRLGQIDDHQLMDYYGQDLDIYYRLENVISPIEKEIKQLINQFVSVLGCHITSHPMSEGETDFFIDSEKERVISAIVDPSDGNILYIDENFINQNSLY